MRSITTVAAALTTVLAATFPTYAQVAEPTDVRWESQIVPQARLTSSVGVAVSGDGRTAYAVGNFRTEPTQDREDAFVHATDVATGETRWSTTLPRDLHVGNVAVLPGTDTVVTAGTSWRRGQTSVEIRTFRPDGAPVWTARVPRRSLHDLAVDAGTGRVCAASATASGRTWTTTCWTPSGERAFSRDFRSRSNSWPDALVIDDTTHHVFVAGALEVQRRGRITVLARSASGRKIWQRTTRVSETYPQVEDVAIDPEARRLYVLLDDSRRARVLGHRITNGTVAFSRSFGSGRGKTPRPQFIDVLPRSHRVVVTSHGRPDYIGTLRYLDRRGKQVALTRFSECCDLTEPVVDPLTDQLSVAWGPGTIVEGEPMHDEGVGAGTWDADGVRVSDLDVLPAGGVQRVGGVAVAGADLLVLGDRRWYVEGGPRGAFLVAARRPGPA